MQIAWCRTLIADDDLARTTIYFRITCWKRWRTVGRVDVLWRRLVAVVQPPAPGLQRPRLKNPEPSRSDCHAWGAHPLFHFFRLVVGNQARFRRICHGGNCARIRLFNAVQGDLVHPRGTISATLQRRGEHLSAAKFRCPMA
jgi:hypothetical protein